jgi:hypothetical protein
MQGRLEFAGFFQTTLAGCWVLLASAFIDIHVHTNSITIDFSDAPSSQRELSSTPSQKNQLLWIS